MNWETALYLLPYTVALAISLSVGWYAFRRRTFAPAASFAFFILAESVYTVAYLLEVAAPSLNAKLFFDDLQLAAIYAAPLGFLSFALQYSNARIRRPLRFWATLVVVPILGTAVAFTDALHGLCRTGIHIQPGDPFDQLDYTFTPVFLAFAFYAYGMTLAACALLARLMLRTQAAFRSRITTILIGLAAPIVGAGLVMARVTHVFYLEALPLSFAVSNVIVAWGLFRYQLLEIVPIARAAIVESLQDAVLVIDLHQRVIDYNPAAEAVTGIDLSAALGRRARDVFPRWASLIDQFENFSRDVQLDVAVEEGLPGERRIEVRLSPVCDVRGRPNARLIIVRDVTERFRAEAELRAYRDNLEAQIAERTAELTQANARLSAEIAERERAQSALQLNEARYRRATRAGKVGVWEWSADQATLYLAPDLLAMLDYDEASPTEQAPFEWRRLVHPDDLPALTGAIRALLDGVAQDFEVNVRMRRRNGGERWMATRGVLVGDGAGGLVRLVGTVSDVTEVMRVQDALQRRDAILQAVNTAAQQLLRANQWESVIDSILAALGGATGVDRVVLHRAVPDDVGRLNGRLVRLWAAPGVDAREGDPLFRDVAITGARLEPVFDLGGTGQSCAVHVDDLPEAAQAWARAWGVQSLLNVPVTAQRTLWGLLSLHMVREPRDWPPTDVEAVQTAASMLGTAVERQEARDSLQQYADRLRALHEIDKQILSAQSTQDVAESALESLRRVVPCQQASITILDEQTRTATIISAPNAADAPVEVATSTVQFDREQQHRGGVWVIGDLAAYDGRPEATPSLQRLIEQGVQSAVNVPMLYEGRLIGTLTLAHDARYRFSADDVDAVQQVAAQLAIAVHQAHLHDQVQQYAGDLEQRVAERTAELQATTAHLQALTTLKDEFVSNVSHELRTPISNLKLYLDLLALRPERADYYGDVLTRETNRLEALIEDLLTLSRLDQDRIPLRRRPVDLNRLVSEYVEDRRAMAEQHALTLKFTPAPDLPPAHADAGLIGQVLSILLTNAFHYTPDGGRVEALTRLEQRNGSSWAAFCVRDDGPGVPPDERDRLFTRFFRGRVGRESGASGTGLGLAIAQEIVARHAGLIEVSSSGVAGEGAAFTVLLPTSEAEESA